MSKNVPYIEHLLAHYAKPQLETESSFVTCYFTLHLRVRKLLLSSFSESYSQLVQLEDNQKLQARLIDIIDKGIKTKIVVVHRPVANFAPKYIEYKIFIGDSADSSALAEHVYGFGQSFFSESEAFDKAVGEFLERYFLSTDWRHETRLATRNQLGNSAVSLEGTALYTETQNKSNNLVTWENRNTALIGWVKVQQCFGFIKKYVPAQRVFWMPKLAEGENYTNHPTSNGGAGAFSKKRAMLGGIYELIERDSFMYHWLLKVSPKKIDEATITSAGYVESRYFLTRYKSEAHFFDISTTAIPAILCIIIDRSVPHDPKFSFGAAAGIDTDRLIDGSYMEALVVQRNHWFTNESNKVDFQDACFFDDPTFDGADLNNRIRFWRGLKSETQLSFLFAGEHISYTNFITSHPIPSYTKTLRGEYRYIKSIFSRLVARYGAAYQPYVYYVQHKLLSNLNYYVANVVVMGLYPLYLVEHRINQDILHIKHWEEHSVKENRDWRGEIVNMYPHPFP